jgi:phage portal protein BeeE
MNYALERFFGFKISEDVHGVPALQPELRDQAAYYATLVNTGIMTPNEVRDAMNMESIDGHDDLRIPANIAGSAADPSEGGRPPEEEENTNEQTSDS